MKLSYVQARECVFRAYNARGFHGGVELAEMLQKIGFISLQDRSNLKEMLIVIEQALDEQKRQSKLSLKILNKFKKVELNVPSIVKQANPGPV